jgi:hypothetical protein
MNLTELAAAFENNANELTGYAEHAAFEMGAEDMEHRARRIEAARVADAEVAIDEQAQAAEPTRAQRIAAVVAASAEPASARNAFVQDVVGKFRRYGSLSDRQLSALENAVARDREFAANVAPKGDAPEGKATISGAVVSTKWHESNYGGSMKMTVKIDNGARVWMTVPSGYGINKGDRLTVSATFTRSETDRSFAFGKRPRVVEHVPATVAA